MSDAIADVSNTLIDLLRAQATSIPADAIALISPAEVNRTQGVLLSLSLYSLIPAADCRNEMEIFGDESSGHRRAQPLELYYLLTAYPAAGDDPTRRNTDAQRALGQAMRVFLENGILTGSVLRGALPRDEEMRLSFQPMTVEDLTRIFGVFPDNALQTSVSYVVSPVKLYGSVVTDGAPVARRSSRAGQALPSTREN